MQGECHARGQFVACLLDLCDLNGGAVLPAASVNVCSHATIGGFLLVVRFSDISAGPIGSVQPTGQDEQADNRAIVCQSRASLAGGVL